MSLRSKAESMWQEPYGGLLVILIAYAPAPIIYLFLKNMWRLNALYTSLWSVAFTAVFWYGLDSLLRFLSKENSQESIGREDDINA